MLGGTIIEVINLKKEYRKKIKIKKPKIRMK
jgi:hypothetical protein